MKSMFMCLDEDCLCVQPGDDWMDGADCPNCGTGVLRQVVVVTREEIEGRSGDYIAAEVRAAFDKV
jgi:hypothetical protein